MAESFRWVQDAEGDADEVAAIYAERRDAIRDATARRLGGHHGEHEVRRLDAELADLMRCKEALLAAHLEQVVASAACAAAMRRADEAAATTSCSLRMARSLAGNGWGAPLAKALGLYGKLPKDQAAIRQLARRVLQALDDGLPEEAPSGRPDVRSSLPGLHVSLREATAELDTLLQQRLAAEAQVDATEAVRDRAKEAFGEALERVAKLVSVHLDAAGERDAAQALTLRRPNGKGLVRVYCRVRPRRSPAARPERPEEPAA